MACFSSVFSFAFDSSIAMGTDFSALLLACRAKRKIFCILLLMNF